jgi:hypothetical protein
MYWPGQFMEVSSTEKRSTSGGRTETLAWPDDHDFIDISKHGQDQAISVLQYDYHTKMIQEVFGQLWSMQFKLVGMDVRQGRG